jgi:Tfp pilus assembly protein PilF
MLTLLCYSGVVRLGFVHDFDDGGYVSGNPHVLGGITLEGVRWAFSSMQMGNWHPLTWLSHMLDVQFFGAGPLAPHIVNLVLHIVNTLLLLVLLAKMTGDSWRSAIVAALFAVHPLHVESVAWVSERKDVLCALFFLLTIAAYLRFLESRSPGRYLLLLAAFGAALMSKPMAVTLPFVLLLLDRWPLARFSAGAGAFRIVLEKVPLFALSILSGGVTYLAQEGGHAVSAIPDLPMADRVANAAVSYVRYLRKTVWPIDLSAFYPLPSNGHPAWLTWAAAISLVALSAVVLREVNRRPWLFTGWFWFLGTLVPVIGLVQVGAQSMADRYSYIPHMGLFIAAVWGVGELARTERWRRLLAAAVGLAVAACAFSTWRQVPYWRDEVALFRHATEVTERNAFSYYNLGAAFAKQGKAGEAVGCYEEALSLAPGFLKARYNLATALAESGKRREAVIQYRILLQAAPDHPEALNNLAYLYATADERDLYRPGEALRLANRAVSFSRTPVTLDTLAEALHRTGDRAGALKAIDEAIAFAPADLDRYRKQRAKFLGPSPDAFR